MNDRNLIRGEKHHWWPEGLSQHWANQCGLVHRITPRGVIQKIPPKKLARISDGHNITFEEPSPWDHTFEQEYDRVDADFPVIIKWLDDLRQRHPKDKANEAEYYFPHSDENEFLDRLCGCLVSLTVRSPKSRNSVVKFVEEIRGPINKKEQKRLIAANIQHMQEEITESLIGRGKFVFFSPNRANSSLGMVFITTSR